VRIGRGRLEGRPCVRADEGPGDPAEHGHGDTQQGGGDDRAEAPHGSGDDDGALELLAQAVAEAETASEREEGDDPAVPAVAVEDAQDADGDDDRRPDERKLAELVEERIRVVEDVEIGVDVLQETFALLGEQVRGAGHGSSR
jgi:hypothetical protein